jgi:Bacterial PH domain
MKQSKHHKAFLERHLKPGEAVVCWIEGRARSGLRCMMLVTDLRVVVYRSGFFGEVLESLPLKSITSVDRKTVLGQRMLRLRSAHDILEFKTFDQAGADALAQVVDAAGNKPAVVPTQVDVLTMLAGLKNAGVLSDKEFEVKKAELLARI